MGSTPGGRPFFLCLCALDVYGDMSSCNGKLSLASTFAGLTVLFS